MKICLSVRTIGRESGPTFDVTKVVRRPTFEIVLSADRKKLRLGEPPLRKPKPSDFRCESHPTSDVSAKSKGLELLRATVAEGLELLGADSAEGRMEEEPILRKEEWFREPIQWKE